MASLSSTETAGDQERPVSLRQQQRAVTRERILHALAELLETEHPLEVSMAAVAERAGVSEPTLYRHFSTKRKLFAALGSDLFRRVTAGIAPTNLDELVEIMPTLFRRFAEMESTARWMLAAPEGEAVPRPSPAERFEMLREAVGGTFDDRRAAQSEFMLRGLLLLTSPLSLIYWQDYLGITVDEAADTAAWLIRQLAKE